MRQTKTRGFTLVEVLIVVVIMAVLAAVVAGMVAWFYPTTWLRAGMINLAAVLIAFGGFESYLWLSSPSPMT